MSKEAIAKAPSGRPSRTRVGYRNRLSVANMDPDYEYRWVNDSDGTGDRIRQLEEAGYEKVPAGAHRVGDPRVDVGSPLGSVESMKVGNGQTAYLMRQKKEWYQEDQADKQKMVDATEEALKKPKFDGAYGKVKISDSE